MSLASLVQEWVDCLEYELEQEKVATVQLMREVDGNEEALQEVQEKVDQRDAIIIGTKSQTKELNQ